MDGQVRKPGQQVFPATDGLGDGLTPLLWRRPPLDEPLRRSQCRIREDATGSPKRSCLRRQATSCESDEVVM